MNTLLQYDDFAVSVEGTWDLPACYPFQATFRVVFEKAMVENDANGFVLYTADGAQKIQIEKKELADAAASLKFLLKKELVFHG